MKNQYISNLSFFLNYSDGTALDEIEYELYKLAFQSKGNVHYDRDLGGEFENVEQESLNAAQMLMFQFGTSMIESVYKMNEEKGFDPYIVVGFSDINIEIEGTTVYVTIDYRLLNDLSIAGNIQLEI